MELWRHGHPRFSLISIDFRGFGRMDGPTNGWTDRQMDRRMDWQTHAASRIKKRSSTFNHNCISDPRPRKWRKKNQWEARKRRKKNLALLIGSFFSILVPFDPFHLYQLAKSKICTAPTLTPCFYQFPFLPLPRAPGRYGRATQNHYSPLPIFFLDLDLGSSLKVEREIKS